MFNLNLYRYEKITYDVSAVGINAGVLIQGNEVVTKKAFLQKESSFSKTTLKKEKKGIKIPQQSFTTFFKEENKIKVLAT